MAWGGDRENIVHSGYYLVPKATVICKWHGPGGVTTETKGCEMWTEQGREYPREKEQKVVESCDG